MGLNYTYCYIFSFSHNTAARTLSIHYEQIYFIHFSHCMVIQQVSFDGFRLFLSFLFYHMVRSILFCSAITKNVALNLFIHVFCKLGEYLCRIHFQKSVGSEYRWILHFYRYCQRLHKMHQYKPPPRYIQCFNTSFQHQVISKFKIFTILICKRWSNIQAKSF